MVAVWKIGKCGIWSLFANLVTYCHGNSSTTPLHLPARWTGGRSSTARPCSLFSDMPSFFQRARSPLCSIQEGKVFQGNVPVWFLHLVKRPGYPSCNGLHQDNAIVCRFVCVFLYKRGEERVRRGKKVTREVSPQWAVLYISTNLWPHSERWGSRLGLTLSADAQQGLLYLACVCVSVCLSPHILSLQGLSWLISDTNSSSATRARKVMWWFCLNGGVREIWR